MDTIMEIVKNLDWTPLFISFKTGIVATVISFFLGLFAARKVVRAGERAKAIADGFLTLPTPSSACGSGLPAGACRRKAGWAWRCGNRQVDNW